jgi:hypothetical protein
MLQQGVVHLDRAVERVDLAVVRLRIFQEGDATVAKVSRFARFSRGKAETLRLRASEG